MAPNGPLVAISTITPQSTMRGRAIFRFNTKAKIIVYAWVNDTNTLRTYGAKNDAYAVFARMLNDGNPPDSWENLVAECNKPATVRRVREVFDKR